MRTTYVSPMEALVVPRTIAVVTMLPLLGFYSLIGDHRRRIALLGAARHPADHFRPAKTAKWCRLTICGSVDYGAGVRRDHRHCRLL